MSISPLSPYTQQFQSGVEGINSWKELERKANSRVAEHISDVTNRPTQGDGINSLKYAVRGLQGVTSHQAQQMRNMQALIELQNTAIEKLADKAKIDLDA